MEKKPDSTAMRKAELRASFRARQKRMDAEREKVLRALEDLRRMAAARRRDRPHWF